MLFLWTNLSLWKKFNATSHFSSLIFYHTMFIGVAKTLETKSFQLCLQLFLKAFVGKRVNKDNILFFSSILSWLYCFFSRFTRTSLPTNYFVLHFTRTSILLTWLCIWVIQQAHNKVSCFLFNMPISWLECTLEL